MSTTSKVLCTNNAVGTLQGLHSASATEFTLSGSQGDSFPTISDGNCFYLTIEDTLGNMEVVKVTARTGSTLTVVRGQSGTTAREWASSTEVSLRATAELFEDKVDLKSYEARWTTEKATLNTAINSKFASAGGTISGDLTVTGDTAVDDLTASGDVTVTGALNVTGTVTADVAWSSVTGKPDFATVATSGSYNDLSNTPSLATVATSGSYNDLSNKPGAASANAYITSRWSSGTQWYRVWSDGWIEQGGYVSSNRATITFTRAFSNTNYTVLVTSIGSSGGYAYRIPNYVSSRSSSSFVMYAENENAGNWYACGY